MNLQFNTYSIILLISGIAAAIVGIGLFQQRRVAIRWFSIMMFASAVWAISYAFELSSSTLTEMLFWIDIEYIGVSFIPALWMMFVIHFIEWTKRLTRVNVILIFLIPILTFIMVMTNEYHYLHYASVGLDTSGPFPLLAITTGPWYTIHTIFFYFLMAFGMVLLALQYRRSDKFYRIQIIIILSGALIPWLTNLIYLLGVRPYAHIDLTPYAFIATALIIAFGLMPTELLRAQAELLKAQAKELQELNDLKNQMFSIIAHDLKGPMSGLNGLLKLAESGVLSEQELRNILPLLSKNADNVSSLMENLLSWAQSQLTGSHVHPERVDLQKILNVNVQLFEKRVAEKNINLCNEVTGETLIYADKDMIDLVVRNLIGNAIKFCDTGDTITLRAETNKDFTMLTITDTGVGMDQATQAGLFQLMKSSKSGTRNEKGTGLGLKLCKDFIEQNNGTISVESEAGKGSVFYIALPSYPANLKSNNLKI